MFVKYAPFYGLLLLLRSVHSIYEEQAGLLDWHKANVGRVLHAEFAFRGRERLFVATASNVVASLDTRDGSIAWRQVYGEEDSIESLVLVPRPASVLTLSRKGEVLRAWHAMDGTLLWENILPLDSPADSGSALLVLPDITGDGNSEVAVITGSKLQVLSASSGKQVWIKDTGTVSVLAAAQGPIDDQHAILLASSNASGVHLEAVSTKDGEKLFSQWLVSAATQVALTHKSAVAITPAGELCIASLGQGQSAKATCRLLVDVAPELGPQVQIGPLLDSGEATLHGKDASVIIQLGTNKIVATHKGMTIAGKAPDNAVGFVGVTSKGLLQTALTDASSGRVMETKSTPIGLSTASGQPLSIDKVVIGVKRVGDYSKPEATVHRWVVTAEDDSLRLVEGGKVVWHREEGLARVQSTLMVDLPASTAELDAELKAARPTLMDRVNAEILTIKNSLGLISPEEQARLKEINSQISTHLLPHRDANGFRKLILALSASGTLYGLHSGNGRILWQAAFSGEAKPTKIFQWRSSHDPRQPLEILLLGTVGPHCVFSILNAHTGKVLRTGKLQGPIQQVTELATTLVESSAEQHVFALTSEDGSITILPDSPASTALLKDQALFFWNYSCATGVLAGYRVDGHSLKAEEQWATVFSGPSNTILSIAARDPHEHVYSYAKVLGDRSLKLKYLNPNVIFLVSGPPDGAFSSALGEIVLTVQLIDTISGQIIYRQSLEGARGPVRAVLMENWVVYSYYSTSNQRHEIAVLEFYDAQARSLSIPSLLFGNQSTSLSSYSPTPIEVLHQAYFLGTGIKAIAATATRRGITSKQLLLGTESNQVYLMDKRFLDPRRPKGTPTNDEKAEMLPPYSEELPFAPTLYATHKEVVEGLRGIVTSPANLESTTLTLSFGLDLFFTRVQPSKTFDLLPDDFPYAMLILVTAALTAGAVLLKRMEDANAVKKKWM